MVDHCEVHYSNWAYLQYNKLVDVNKYEHLQLTPKSLMESSDFLMKSFWTVVNYNRKLHHLRLEDELLKATGYKLSDFMDFAPGDLRIFL